MQEAGKMYSHSLVDPVLLDFSKTCRLCLHQSSELTPLYPETMSVENPLPSRIKACVAIEVSSDNTVMPKSVCSKCIDNIDNWLRFKELCESSNTLLLQCLANLQFSSSDDPETLKFSLHGPDNTLLPDMDVSMFEDSLFGQFDQDGSLQLSEDLNMSFSESILGQKVQLNKKSSECNLDDVNAISRVVSANRLEDVSCVNVVTKDVVDMVNCQTERVDELSKVSSKSKCDELYWKRYPCDLCNKAFTKFLRLLQHDRVDHSDRLNDFSCPVCGALFVSQSRIDVHILQHREKTFECPHCHKMMVSKKSLSVHLRLHSSKNRYICNICNAVKGSRRILNDHIRSVHIIETPFRCKLCGKLFKTKQSREKHQRRHLHKQFKCNICGCLQQNSDNYKSHMESHNIDKSIVCDICGKLFKTKLLLAGHLQTHSTYKPFKCLICSRSFFKRYLLVRHESIHLDLYPFSCLHCDKTFKRKDLLTAHVRLHTGEKRYSCNKCFTAYFSLRSLKRHKCLRKRKESNSKRKESNSKRKENIKL